MIFVVVFATRRSWWYVGSLTSPPCTAGVEWVVMRDALVMDSAVLAFFRTKTEDAVLKVGGGGVFPVLTFMNHESCLLLWSLVFLCIGIVYVRLLRFFSQ